MNVGKLTDELQTLVTTYKVLMHNLHDRASAVSNLKMIYLLEKVLKMVYQMDPAISFEQLDLFDNQYKEHNISPILIMSRIQQGMIPMTIEALHRRIDEIHDDLRREMRSQYKTIDEDKQYDRILDFLLKRSI